MELMFAFNSSYNLSRALLTTLLELSSSESSSESEAAPFESQNTCDENQRNDLFSQNITSICFNI